jgi:vacuolar-type H+-ATPase subunit I/STV1
MYQHINTSLGQARALLPQTATADEMLRQRVAFQIDHAREIVAVLKYYLTYRSAFGYTGHGFVPEKAYEHMREVLARGQGTGEFAINDLDTEAKVMTHAVNGFLLEYHPYSPQGEEKKQLVETITGFLLRALVNRSCDTTSPLS